MRAKQHYRCIFLVFFMIALFIPATAAEERDNTIRLKSRIKEVTVYADHAHITRAAYKNLPKGTHQLTLDLLSKDFDKDSILVDGKGPAEIQGVRVVEGHIKPYPKTRIAELKNKIKKLHEQQGILDLKLEIANEDQRFMDKMTDKIPRQMEKEKTPLVDTEKWAKMVHFHRGKIETLKKEIWDIKREKKLLTAREENTKKHIAGLEEESRATKHQVAVTVSMKQTGNLKLTVSYDVSGPFWYPRYELRVDSKTKRAELRYFGVVCQETDEVWKDVRIKLSTAKPSLGSSHGEMRPQFLSLYSGSHNNGGGQPFSFNGKQASENTFYVDGVDTTTLFEGTSGEKGLQWGRQAVAGAPTAVEFIAGDHQTVKQGKAGLRVTIMTYKCPVHFRYSSIPKLSRYAYLKAHMVNKTKYPLLTGESSMFLDGTLITASKLAYAAPGTDFWVFLGADRGIDVEYSATSNKDDNGKKNKKIKFERLISIKNNKNTDIELVVFDQVPVPKDSGIKVKIKTPKNIGKRKDIHYNKNNLGELQWILHPKPGEEVKLPLVYTLEYPAGKGIKTSSG